MPNFAPPHLPSKATFAHGDLPDTLRAVRPQLMPTLGFSIKKSLQELEGITWGKPERSDTGLVKTCYRLHRLPLQDFTPGDLRVMIGQQIGLDFLIPLALENVERDPLVEGSFYPCDLLVNILTIDVEFWHRHPDLRARAAQVAARAIELLRSRPDAANKTATRSVRHAYEEFQMKSGVA